MSSKRPHPSSDEEFDKAPSDVRRFIDDVAMESDGEEEFDDDDGDPDQSEFMLSSCPAFV